MTALSEPARALWAKSDRGRAPGEWHPLIAHLLDVAACAREILEREPPSTLDLLAADLNLPRDRALAWTCALAGLHDLGKASPAFQQKWPDGMERVKKLLPWPANQQRPPNDVPHGQISHVALDELLRTEGWAADAARLAADAVGAHHGWRAPGGALGRASARSERGGPTWQAARQELLRTALAALEAGPAPAVERLSAGAFQRLAGLTSFADWIGSSLPFAAFDGDARAYFQGARSRARSALTALGWVKRLPLAPERRPLEDAFAHLAPDGTFTPRPLQLEIARALETLDGPTLLLVEAPMGEGKTEAALYAHLELQRQIGHRGLYVALPTQATGNAMFLRVQDFLRAAGRATPPDLQLLHGATLLVDAYQRIIVQPNTPDDALEGVAARAYFTHRKRAMLSEYGVGTVDQALTAILHVKHQFVRLWGLSNRVVILDEVHAYDTYTGRLIERLVAWLRALGSSVVLMSATLPTATRERLLNAWDAVERPDAAYPRLTVVSGERATATTFDTRVQKPIRLESLAQDDHAVAARALGLAQAGGCVAVVVNTVDRAQRLYRSLAANPGVPVHLFHARYPLEERRAREEAVLELFGKGRGNPAGPNPKRPDKAILIGTQVIEQSLDLDFDAMISDLAPVDLLLQRAGRLHRHALNDARRYAHAQPVLLVSGIEAAGGAPDLRANHWSRVYDEFVLLKTWLALEEHGSRVELPADLDILVQRVYDDRIPPGLPDALRERLESARARLEHNDLSDTLDANAAVIGDPRDASWEDPHRPRGRDDDEAPSAGTLPVSTRKGDKSVTVVPLHARDGRYYLRQHDAEAVSLAAELSLDAAKAVYARTVRLSRRELTDGLERHARERLATLPWRETPLLQNVLPLVLEDGTSLVGKLETRLDPKLGIVYSRLPTGQANA